MPIFSPSKTPYYIDKSGIIAELIDGGCTVNLITCPRGFGKTFTLNMLKRFFSPISSKTMFSNWEISENAEICERYMGQYPVLFLDFSDFQAKDFGDALRSMAVIVSATAFNHYYLKDCKNVFPDDKNLLRTYMSLTKIKSLPRDRGTLIGILEDSLHQICRILCEHYEKKVVVLIDDYDIPLREAYANGYGDEMAELLSGMLELLLKENKCLEFGVLVGELQLPKAGVTTGLNNVFAWGEDDFQKDYFGFTEDEVQSLLQRLDLTDTIEAAQNYYKGYRFGHEQLYCPLDITKYIAHCVLDNNKDPVGFWTGTGNHDLISLLLENEYHRADYKDLIARETIFASFDDATCSDLAEPKNNILGLLTALGYLVKVPSEEENEFDELLPRECYLRIPNEEVRELFRQILQVWEQKHGKL